MATIDLTDRNILTDEDIGALIMCVKSLLRKLECYQHLQTPLGRIVQEMRHERVNYIGVIPALVITLEQWANELEALDQAQRRGEW